MITREIIENEIREFVAGSDRGSPLANIWRQPLVGFADVSHQGFAALRELVHPKHELPGDVLTGATVVVTYFIPFSEEIVLSNSGGGLSSPQWARSYEITNEMLSKLCSHLIDFLRGHGYRAAVSGEASVFDRKNVTSRWSQRHIARLAGLGTFGLNNMLITEAGCAGRFGSVVTDLDLTPDTPLASENCLFKRSGQYGVCARQCPSGALTAERFDRHSCYAQCLKNAAVYTQFGASYAPATGGGQADSGSEVCGKCLVGLPCSMSKP